MKVFISYSRQDIKIAEKLRNDLEKAGIKTWQDKEELSPGQSWKTVIIEAIRKSSHFIALLSFNSLSKEGFVQKELKTALDFIDYLPAGRIFLIPARLDECEPADEKLRDIQWADLFPSYEKGFQDILRVLRGNSNIQHTLDIFEKNNNTITPPSGDNRSSAKLNIWIILIVSALVIASLVYPVEIKNEDVATVSTEKSMTQKPIYNLRIKPIKVSRDESLRTFNLKKDKNGLLQPSNYVRNNFIDNQNGTITDHATGLMWQKSRSDNKLTYEGATTYIDDLNQRRFVQYDDWRLPTVDELRSLLLENKQSNGMYIDPIFEDKKGSKLCFCWTSDQLEDGGVFQINFSYGSIGWLISVKGYVRAVRSIYNDLNQD